MDYTVRPYKKGEERYVAEAHRRVYTEEYRWGDVFTSYAVAVAMDFAAKEQSPREGLWVAEERESGSLVGCVMLCETEERETGQLRLFLVEKEHRRFGVGASLVKALMERARLSGYKRLILWTASPLTDAIGFYKRLGFVETEAVENTTWSLDGEALSEIKMELELDETH